MTDLLSDLETPSDAELISRVRGGDVAAYGELFSRHRDAANRLARQLVRGSDSDDLVSEAFAKVLSVLQGGGGPDVAFRAYLLTAVRRLHVDRVRSGSRLQTTGDMTPFDAGVPFQDTAVAGFESGAAAKAFASLPERWQLVLWHLEVEGQKPADIAPLLGMSANSVSALAYRAREGLRQAFLTMHIADLTETDCRWVNEHLGAFIRKGLSKRDTGKVQEHLDGCRRCTAMYLELTEVNSNLAGIIAPLLLGAAASGYLASSGVGTAGVLGLVSRVKDFVAANSTGVTAVGVAAGVATAAAVAAVTLSGGAAKKSDVAADVPAAASTPAAVAPTLPPPTPSTRTASAPPPIGSTASLTTGPTASPTASAPVSPTPSATLPAPLVPAAALAPLLAPTAAAGSLVSRVDLSGTTIDDTGVHLAALGSPDLPPILTVHLISDPGGVAFAPSGDCTLVDATTATCTTLSGAGGRVPGTARMVAASSYTAELPFDIPVDQQDTDLSISVDVPVGFEVSGGAASVKPWMSRFADVGLAMPASIDAASDHSYTLQSVLSGIPTGNAQGMTFTLKGPASFTEPAPAGCRLVAVSVVCGSAANGPVPLVVRADDDSSATSVTVSAAPLGGYRDGNRVNNSATTTLQKFVAPAQEADLRLTLRDKKASASPDGSYSVPAVLTNVPPKYAGPVTFRISSGGATFANGDPGCRATGTVLVCDTAGDGNVPLALRAEDDTADTPVTITVDPLAGYADPNADNNSDVTTLSAAPPTVLATALALSPRTPLALSPNADDRYATSVTLGVGGDLPPQVTFSLPADSAASLVSVSGCAVAPGAKSATCVDPADGTTYDLVLTAPLDRQTDVPVTVTAPVIYTETDTSDNTRILSLQPSTHVDVALTGLTPATARPRADDVYDLSGTLSVAGPARGAVRDVTYSITGAQFATGAGLASTVTRSAADTTPAFTITHRGASTVVVTADAPGFTETNPADNEATATLSPYDVRLSGLAASSTTDAHGEQQFTADLVRDGFTGHVTYTLEAPGDLQLTGSKEGTSTVTFTVHSASRDQKPASIRIRADLAAGFTDADATNNSDTASYTYLSTPPPPTADLRLKVTSAINGNSGQGTVATSVAGAPSGATVTLHVTFDPDQVVLHAPSGCSTTGLGAVTCTYVGPGVPDGSFDVALTDRPSQHGSTTKIDFDVSASGYDETAPADNHGTVSITRK